MFKQKRGFTLIELLVVIAIIGLLAAVVLASLSTAQQKGRDARRISDVKEIQLALDLYYDANNNYPPTPTGDNVSGLGTGTYSIVPNYISSIPVDPQGGTKAYGYIALPAGCDNSATTCTTYVIAAQLESANSATGASYMGYTGNITVNATTDTCTATVNLYCATSN